MSSPRPSGRAADQLRPVTLEVGTARHAEGSCLIRFGHTVVRCTASIEQSVPRFLKNTGKGWITAEYGMLPRATHTRGEREAAKGKQSGRTQEIQRLIGRSLRAVTDMRLLGERQIILDCDVIEADGGTRTASITGAYVALSQAIGKLIKAGELRASPLIAQAAAVSCGMVKGAPVLDLDYDEDSACEMDANFVMTSDGRIIEIQCTAEDAPIEDAQFHSLLALAKSGIHELCRLQREALGH